VKRAYAPDGKRWAEWTTAGAVTLTAGPDAKPVPVPHPAAADAVKWCDGGERFVVSGGGTARGWQADGTPAGPPLPVNTDAHDPNAHHLSRDGRRLAAWDDRKTVSVWDVTTGKRLFGPAAHPDLGPVIFGDPSNDGVVKHVALSPDGSKLAVGIDSSGTLTVWDVDRGGILNHHRRFRGYVYVLRFSADGRRVLAYTSDNQARLYDAATGSPAGPPVRQAVISTGCDVAPDGRRVVVFDPSADALRVWDAARGERLATIPLGGRRPTFLWFATDGRSVNAMIANRSYTYPLPRFELPVADAGRLCLLLAGQRIDDTDGIDFVDQFTFKSDADGFRRLWRAWRGLAAE
jgi:WD40 repeat protein